MLLLGAVVTGLFLVLYLLSTQVVHRGFLQLEETYAHRNVKRVLSIFEFLPGELMTTVQDWAMWDDTYRFAEDGDTAYVDANLDAGTYETLKIDLFLITNSSGEVVWGHGFDPETSELTPIPDDLLAMVRSGLPSSHVPTEYGGAAGTVLLKDGPAIIAMNPILTSDRKGPSRGTLVMVRYLDKRGAAQMESNLQLSLSVFRADAPPDDPVVEEMLSRLTASDGVEVYRVNEDTVAGFGLVRDLFGKPALLVQVGMPRDIYHQSIHTTALLMTVLALSGVVLCVTIMILLRRQILSRVERLSRGVGRFSAGSSQDAISLTGQDELSALANEINQALEREAEAKEALRESEGRVRAKLDAILLPEGDISTLELADIIDIPAVQTIMDDLYALTSKGSAILDVKGKVLVAAGWQDICTEFHRVHPESCKNCHESDTLLTTGVEQGKFKVYKCKNGMWDMATPIYVGGRHVGNVFFGQFFYKEEGSPDREAFRAQARRYGFDEEAYLAALDRVPRLNRETVERLMMFYSRLGAFISTLGYGNLKLARSLEERQRIEEKLRVNEASLRLANAQLNRAQRIARIGSWTYDPVTHRASWTEEMFRIFGVDPKGGEPSYEELRKLIHPDHRKAFYEAIEAGREHGKPVSLDLRVVRPDGTERIVHHQWETVPNEGSEGFHYLGTTQDITERKKAEEELRKSEERFRAVFEATSDSIIILDRQLRYLYVNQAACDHIGNVADDFLGNTMRQVFKHLPDVPNLWEPRISGVFETGVPIRVEDSLLVDGRIVHSESAVFPLKTPDGSMFAAGIIYRDITERKQAEERLLRAYDKVKELEHIVSKSPAVAFLWRNDEGWPVEFVSDNVLSLFGYTAEEFLSGKVSYSDTIHPDDFDRVVNEVSTQSGQEGRERFDHDPYRIVARDGTLKWIMDSTEIRRDENGQVTHYQGIVQDITERIRAEETLRESEKKYRMVTDSAADVIWEADLEGNFRFLTPSFEKLHGYTVEEGLTKNMRDVLTPDSYQVVQDGIRERMEGLRSNPGARTPVRLEVEYAHKDGSTFWGEVAPRFVTDEAGRPVGMTGVTRDITERKKAEEALAQRAAELEMATHVAEKNASELANALEEVKAAERERRALEEQLHQSQKMESLGILAGGIAHDFNNILHGIMGYTSLMRSEVDSECEFYGYVDHVETAVKRAGELTQQLLSFARKGKYDVVSIDLVPAIDEVVDFLKRGFNRNVEVQTEYGEAIGAISGDKSQIHQAVMNLCINAAQAMPDGGTLTIRVENVSITSDDNLGMEDAEPGDYVLLTFSDTGVGMSEETLGRIFEPFFTTKGPGEGTGLGLSMVFGVAKNHGGAVDVTSKPGEGTTFRLLLPRVGAKPEVPTPEPALEPERPRPEPIDVSSSVSPAGTVLVVDDEEVILTLASRMLHKIGWQTLIARDGNEAVRIYREKHSQIAVVLLDMKMPGMGGLETFRELRKINPSARVIVSSGYDKDENTQQVLKEGAVSLLKKPYLFESLSDAIRTASLNPGDTILSSH